MKVSGKKYVPMGIFSICHNTIGLTGEYTCQKLLLYELDFFVKESNKNRSAISVKPDGLIQKETFLIYKWQDMYKVMNKVLKINIITRS